MKTKPMNELYLFRLGSLCALALGASLVGLFFDKHETEFKKALTTMLGGFFFGSAIAYLIHDADLNKQLIRAIVFLSAMFAKPLYEKLKDKFPIWLDLYVTGKIRQKTSTENEQNNFLPPAAEDENNFNNDKNISP